MALNYLSLSILPLFTLFSTNLRAQMKWCEPSLGLGISTGTILQQCGGNVHLILASSDVERSVAILCSGMR